MLSGFLGLSALFAAAGAQADAALVEFANFDCPDCQAMRPHHAAIESAAEKAGLEYRYAPIPLSGDPANAWRERTYYAARALPDMEGRVRRALLTGGGEDAETGLDATLGALSMHIPEVEWEAFARDYIEQPESLEALERALSLVKRAEIRDVPTYLLVTSSGVEVIPTSADDASERADDVIEYLEEYEP